jgi:hypothetical protein
MPAEFAGRHPHPVPEGLREMALVRESGCEGDLDQGGVGCRESLAGEFNPEPADVVALRAAVVPAESLVAIGIPRMTIAIGLTYEPDRPAGTSGPPVRGRSRCWTRFVVRAVVRIISRKRG